MTKIKDLDWFCPQAFTNILVYKLNAPQSCCVLKKWPKNRIRRKYGTTNPTELHNKDEYVDFRNEFLKGDGPLIQKKLSGLYRTRKTFKYKSQTNIFRKIYRRVWRVP